MVSGHFSFTFVLRYVTAVTAHGGTVVSLAMSDWRYCSKLSKVLRPGEAKMSRLEAETTASGGNPTYL